MTKKEIIETKIQKLDTEDYIQQLERKIKNLNNINRDLKKEKQRIVEINMKIISDLENKVKELENKIEGQECVIETQMHNEEVYEELVKKLENKIKELEEMDLSLVYIDGYFKGKDNAETELNITRDKLLEDTIKEKIRIEKENLKIIEQLKNEIKEAERHKERLNAGLHTCTKKDVDSGHWRTLNEMRERTIQEIEIKQSILNKLMQAQ